MKKFYVLLSFLAFLFLVSAAYAGTTYTVKKGDSLHKISKKFNISQSDIREANDLKSSRLSAGMKLTIPSNDKKRKNKAASGKNNSNTTKVSLKNSSLEKSSADTNATYHIVKKGDTAKTIARKYSISVSELKRMNNLKKGRLKVGQQLLIKNSEPKTYTVRKGDTIRRIAKRFKLGVDELKEINGLESASLKPGQKLLLTRKPAESKNDAESANFPYDRKITPVITSARLEEVKELSKSEDILSELSVKERLILFAKKMLHLPYKFGGNGSIGLDCSAYVQKVYGFIGQNIPRSAREQFHVGEAVDKSALSTGDLVFFRTYASFPSHVGIYLGNNLFIHASSVSKKITIDSLESPYYFKRFIGAKRLIPEDDIETGEYPVKEN